MTGAPWWVVLASAAIGAAAAIAGSMWATRTARRSAGRAEWFRRLQWAWELTLADDRRRVAAGTVMMGHLINHVDRTDAEIIVDLAPITREVGPAASRFPGSDAQVDIVRIGSDTGEVAANEGGESHGGRAEAR